MDVLMKKLIDRSVLVNSGMLACYPKYGREEELSTYGIVGEYPHCYAVENETIGFVTGNHLYVIPYTSQVIEILEERDFQKVNFKVPFSNGSSPKYDLMKWEKLREDANQSQTLEFYKRCDKFADAHQIGSISNEALENCFTIPDTGVLVTPSMLAKKYYPVIRERKINREFIENIGTYATHNGVVVFVYRDSTTRVSKKYTIIHELVGAGYKYNHDLAVPFSEGEEPVEYALRVRWESLTS